MSARKAIGPKDVLRSAMLEAAPRISKKRLEELIKKYSKVRIKLSNSEVINLLEHAALG